jgi:hypothetical protein
LKLPLSKRKEFWHRIANDSGKQRGPLLALMGCGLPRTARGDKE